MFGDRGFRRESNIELQIELNCFGENTSVPGNTHACPNHRVGDCPSSEAPGLLRCAMESVPSRLVWLPNCHRICTGEPAIDLNAVSIGHAGYIVAHDSTSPTRFIDTLVQVSPILWQ